MIGEASRKVEHQVQVDIDEAGDIFRALDVARHPVHGIRHPAEQRLGITTMLLLLASTQVSLLPPPCDELTTSEPFAKPRGSGRRAARDILAVEDVGAQVDVAAFEASSTIVGARERASVGWAM